MSQDAAILTGDASAPSARPRSFVFHAKVISALTLASRFLGVFREAIAARYFGAGLVSTSFAVAFTVPNLFRRLFGEGALSASFIPLYAQAIKAGDHAGAQRLAAATVKLLVLILAGITLAGELVLLAIHLAADLPADHALTLKLTAIMLPYVLLICGAAFLSGILQVHRRFALAAATPIVLNVALIASTVIGAWVWGTQSVERQARAIVFVSACVLLAGAAQVGMLVPSLRRVGFRFDLRAALWTPEVRRMLRLTVPVALAAMVLQTSVALDKGLAYFLSQRVDEAGRVVATHFDALGATVRYPMQAGAAARLNWAQFLYQFPLGVFAVALATAIFPALSADAMEADRGPFLAALRKGLRVTLWESVPATAGLALVAGPAVQFLFERGRFTPHDTVLVAASVRIYAIGIWAFSVQQILNKAYYALHDSRTPLLLCAVNLGVNVAVELPLVWTGMGETGMAAGTAASYVAQALLATWLLRRRLGPLGLGELRGHVVKVLAATAAMAAAVWAVQRLPWYPADVRATALPRLLILLATGAASYLAACALLGIGPLRRRPDRTA